MYLLESQWIQHCIDYICEVTWRLGLHVWMLLSRIFRASVNIEDWFSIGSVWAHCWGLEKTLLPAEQHTRLCSGFVWCVSFAPANDFTLKYTALLLGLMIAIYVSAKFQNWVQQCTWLHHYVNILLAHKKISTKRECSIVRNDCRYSFHDTHYGHSIHLYIVVI